MLPSKFRLSKSLEIKKVLSRGKYRHFGNAILIKWLQNTLTHPRVAIVVSKKVSKKAVVRNRIKRALMSVFEGDLLVKIRGYDIVIVVKSDIRQELKEICLNLLSFINKNFINASRANS